MKNMLKKNESTPVPSFDPSPEHFVQIAAGPNGLFALTNAGRVFRKHADDTWQLITVPNFAEE